MMGLNEERVRQIFKNFLTVPLILYGLNKFFAVKREKLLNFRKAFENRRDRLWPAFKIGELAPAGFQNQRVGSDRLL
jgi:hypothetical protein